MTTRIVTPRKGAQADISAAIDYYRAEAGQQIALDFVSALDDAYDLLVRHPEAGSLRYAHALKLPGLRMWPMRRFPYLLVYFDGPGVIDLRRVLHVRRDLPASLQEPDFE